MSSPLKKKKKKRVRHFQKRDRVNGTYFLPRQGEVKQSQELSQRGLVHHVDHAHLCDQEIQDAASGGDCGKKNSQTLNLFLLASVKQTEKDFFTH